MFISNLELKNYNAMIKYCVDIKLEVNRYKKIMIKGSNGIGKSTILNYIWDKNKNLNIFYLRQSDFLVSGTTAEQFINLIKVKYSFKSDVIAKLEEMNLAYIVDQKVRQLSGGEAQKLLIAILLCIDVDLILMDEPLNNLDESSIEMVCDMLDSLEVPCIIVSHIYMRNDCEVSLNEEVRIAS